MSEGKSEDDSDKTLDPTERRLDDAREKGDVPRSQEVKHVALLGGGLAVVTVLAMTLGQALMPMFTRLLGAAHEFPVNTVDTPALAWSVAAQSGVLLAPILALMFGLALLGGLLQGRPTWSTQKLKPQWSKISPAAGLKRLFGMQGLVEFLKTLAKFVVVAVVLAKVVWPERMQLEHLLAAEPSGILPLVRDIVVRMFFAVVIIVGIIWAVDYVYQYQSFMKRMRMSRQEMKDEFKQSEGDPHIKARLRALRLERSRRRMMAAVPDADVVITNPTHYAVALKYEHGQMNAPKVVAKGVDSLAARIRAVASENGVPLMENPPLARALYATVEVDEDIRPEHYQAVAEVISAILKLRRVKPQRLSKTASSL